MRRFRDGWLGRVHIGTTLTALMYELPPVLRALRSEHPRVDLVVTNMATRFSVERILDNTIDLALVTLPVKSEQLKVTPLRAQELVAIFPADTKNIPARVTPEYVAQQPLVLEHDQGAVHGLVMRWLEKQMPLSQEPMHFGIIEAAKQARRVGPRNVDRAGYLGRGAVARLHRAAARSADPLHARPDRASQQAGRPGDRDRAPRAVGDANDHRHRRA